MLAFGRKVEEGGGDEVGGGKDFEVAFGGVVALGAVDDGFGGGIPGDFLERKGVAEQILGKALAADAVVGGDGFLFAVVDVEATPISPPSGPIQWLLQGPPAESNLLAATAAS